MKFTVTCDSCGATQEFKDKMHPSGDNISISVMTTHGYGGTIIDSIDIDCNNYKCNKGVSMDC